MNMLKTTDLFGTVPFLYEGLMQHLTKDGSLPDYSLPVINLFLKLADLDLKAFQVLKIDLINITKTNFDNNLDRLSEVKDQIFLSTFVISC